MIKYTKREMPDLDKVGTTKAYYKVDTVGLIDSDRLVDYMAGMGLGVSKAMAKAVLAQLSSTVTHFLSIGYNVSIEGLGQVSLKIGPKKGREVEDIEEGGTKRNATSLEVTGINFRVDKDFLREVNRACTLERGKTKRLQKSPYGKEERLQKLKDYLSKHGSIDVQSYANMIKMTYSSAYRELEKFAVDPDSGISAMGRKHYKVYVLKKE